MEIKFPTTNAGQPFLPHSPSMRNLSAISTASESTLQAVEVIPNMDANPFHKRSRSDVEKDYFRHVIKLSRQQKIETHVFPDGVTTEKGIFNNGDLLRGFRLNDDAYTFMGTRNHFESCYSLPTPNTDLSTQTTIQFQEVWILTSDELQLRLVQGAYPEFTLYQGCPFTVLFKFAKMGGGGQVISEVFQHPNNNISLHSFLEFLQKPNRDFNMLIPIFMIGDDSLAAILKLAYAHQISINLDLCDTMTGKTLREKAEPLQI